MRNFTEKKYAGIIAKKNTCSYIYRKIIFSFLALLTFGIICGVAVFDAVYRGEDCANDYVRLCFENVFGQCFTFSDCFSEILSASRPDIRTLLFIFISGFTYFCYPANGVMIFAKGFVNGFSLFYIIETIGDIRLYNYKILLILFVLSKVCLCAVAIYLAMHSYIFSYKFREIKSNSSILRRAPITYKYFFVLIYSIGSILIINFLYGLLIHYII